MRLKLLGSFLLASRLLLPCAGATPNPFFVFDNGLNSDSLPNLEAKLDLVKAVGFDGLSWRTDDPGQIEALLQGTQRRGLRLFTIYANFDLAADRLVYDPRLNQILPLCRGLDVLLWPNMTSKVFRHSDPAGDTVAVSGLRDLADRCADHDVRIALYPHVGMWLFRVEDALRVVRQVDRKNVGLTFNLCHALMDGAEDRIPGLLAEAAPHLFVVTIHGADSHPPNPGWPNLIQPLGQGTYDVGIVLRKLRDLDYRGPIGLQCYNLPGEPREFLPSSMAAWRRLADVP